MTVTLTKTTGSPPSGQISCVTVMIVTITSIDVYHWDCNYSNGNYHHLVSGVTVMTVT